MARMKGHILGLNFDGLCPNKSFVSVIRALLVPGPAADPQPTQATPFRGWASSRAEPGCPGRYHLRAADGMSVESAGCHWAWLGLDRPSPVSGGGPGRAVLPAVAGGRPGAL